ncbi:MAG: hypothetical protein AAF928_13260 [Myxococcota bacterium]
MFSRDVRTAAAPAARLTGFLLLSTTALTVNAGCAGRAAPFDKLDQAQVTIMRLQTAPPPAAAPAAGIPAIPGIPPELMGLGQQALQSMQQAGILPPNLNIPGLTPAAPPAPTSNPFPPEPRWSIADQRPVVDDELRDQLLDIFGSDGSFSSTRQGCFTPSMAVSFQSPNQPGPVDVVVSFSCSDAIGFGFQWPHDESGLTPESANELAGVHQQVFGVPPT